MQRLKRLLRRAAILTAIILSCMLITLGVTKILVDRQQPAEFIVYQGATDEEQAPEPPKMQEISGGRPPDVPPVVPIIVSTATVEQSPFPFDPSMLDAAPVSNSGGLGGEGLGDGFGEGNGKGGMGSDKKVASSFSGYLWDMKRTAVGKPSVYEKSSSNGQVLEFESTFYNKTWNVAMLSPYFRAKTQLFSTCFFMPNCRDEEAVHAYDPQGKHGLQKSRWVALYRAKVKAPETGTFRFVGAADTVMAVRFDGKNVLACGLHNLRNATWNEWSDKPDVKKKRHLVEYDGIQAWNMSMGGFEVGEEFDVKKDEWYEMQVMISEIGGGEFGFCLLIEELRPNQAPDKNGKPLYQLFRTAFSAPTVQEAYDAILPENKQSGDEGDLMLIKDIPYDPDSRIWEAKPVDIEERMK